MAARPAARRRGNVDDRPSRERRHQSCTRHQFRSADLAKWNCRVGRPVVERSFGGIFAVVHSARGRGQRTQRSLAGRDRTVNMASQSTQFALASRILHWLMAAMLLPMLLIGVTMVSSLGNYRRLVAIHRPLGIAILILPAIRLVNPMSTTL